MDTDDKQSIFKHDKAIERYLRNPDAVIADRTRYRFIFRVVSGHITDDTIAGIEAVIRDTATDFEYPFHGMNIIGNRIEVKIEVSVNEAPLESAVRFQKRLEQAGTTTQLTYIGTLGKEQSD